MLHVLHSYISVSSLLSYQYTISLLWTNFVVQNTYTIFYLAYFTGFRVMCHEPATMLSHLKIITQTKIVLLAKYKPRYLLREGFNRPNLGGFWGGSPNENNGGKGAMSGIRVSLLASTILGLYYRSMKENILVTGKYPGQYTAPHHFTL